MLEFGNVRVRADNWNKTLQKVGSLVPKAGPGIRISSTKLGHVISADPIFKWRHPWNTTALWVDGKWCINVNHGFVNGDPPMVVGNDIVIGPEDLGKNKFRAASNIVRGARVKFNENNLLIEASDGELSVGISKSEASIGQTVEIIPQQSVEIVNVAWWPVTGTKVVIESVPKMFQKMGVANLQGISATITAQNFDSANIGQIVEKLAISKGDRILRSVDIYLSQSRPMLMTKFVEVDKSGTTGTLLQYQAGYDTSAMDRDGGRARLRQAEDFPANKEPDLLLRLLGQEADEPEDRIRIATVYFLSRDNNSAKLDDTWIPYVKHYAFWNLNHMTKNSVPAIPKSRSPFYTGLAGGYGDMIVNQYDALINVIEMQALNWAKEDEVGGAFWST